MEVLRLGSIAYYVEQMSALLPLLSAFPHQHLTGFSLGAIQVLRNAVGGGRVSYSPEKCYEDVRFNVISVTRG